MSPAAPAFADKWQFLFGWVLVGFHDGQRQFYARPGPDGGPLLCMWTDVEQAQAKLPAGWRLLRTPVRPRLAELPAGVGVVVDVDTPGSLIVDPAYAAELKRYVEPFPAGTRSELKLWPLLPHRARSALVEAAQRYAFVDRVWALVYNVDDSPWLGLLVYRTSGGEEAQESIADALESALGASTSPEELEVPAVQVVAFSDLAPDVAASVLEQPALHPA